MKRFLSIILIVCLLPALLAVPVLGAEAAPASVYDLLQSLEYLRSDSNGNSNVSPRSSLWVENALYAEFSWTSPISFEVDRVELAVECDKKPASVQIWNGGRFVDLTYKAAHSGVFYYYLDELVAVNPYRVRVTFDTWFTGTVALRSMHGFVDRAIDVNICDYFTNVVIGCPGSGWSEHIVNDSGSALLPVASHWNGPYDYQFDNDGVYDEMYYAECFYKVSSPIDYAHSASWLVYTAGEINNVGVRLEKSDGTILYAVSSVVEASGDSQIVVDLHEYMHRCKVYRITADLQGYDLSSCVVTLSYEVQPVVVSSAIPYYWGFYSQLTAVSFLPMESAGGLFTRFVSWLGSHLENMEGSLEEIAEVLQSTEPESEEYSDKMQDASDRMDNAAGVLDSVSRPSADSISPGLTGLVDSANVAVAIAPLSSIFSSSTLFPVFLIAFSLALAAYVLFGKRG